MISDQISSLTALENRGWYHVIPSWHHLPYWWTTWSRITAYHQHNTYPVWCHYLKALGDISRVRWETCATRDESQKLDALLIGEVFQNGPEPFDQQVVLIHPTVSAGIKTNWCHFSLFYSSGPKVTIKITLVIILKWIQHICYWKCWSGLQLMSLSSPP